MFRRRSSASEDTGASAVETPEETRARLDGQEAKGRPTPKRKEAQAARKQRLTPPKDRKEAARLMRQKRYEERIRTQAALKSGNEANLPARDRGKVRRFCRDLVDSRRNAAEYLLPLLAVVLLLSLSPSPTAAWLQLVVWLGTIVATVADTLYLVARTKRELARRFPSEQTGGAVRYAVLRSSQLHRFRLPKPQVARGEELPERY